MMGIDPYGFALNRMTMSDKRGKAFFGSIRRYRMEIIRPGKQDYDELMTLFHDVFTRAHGNETDFEKELPAMCVRDDEHMGKHLAVREDGRLVAALGVYLLPAHVGDTPLLFSTVGNVATHWDYEGRGYMAALMKLAMREIEEKGADVSRLGGLRQRYDRYGYEVAGSDYHFTLTSRNVRLRFPETHPITFEKIARTDERDIAFCRSLYEKGAIRYDRPGESFYLTMIAWQCVPYLARNEKGEAIGYLVASPGGTSLAEAFALDDESFTDMLVGWQKAVGKDISFRLAPYEISLNKRFYDVAEHFSVEVPSNFRILKFEKLTDALMKLRNSYSPLAEGRFILDIAGEERLELYAACGEVGCRKSEKPADLSLTRAEATRFLFGPFRPYDEKPVGGIINAWLPLPLCWNPQDRV